MIDPSFWPMHDTRISNALVAFAVTLGFSFFSLSPRAGAASPTAAAEADMPKTTRKIVLDKIERGYRWKLVEAPVPAPGPSQVLVRVRAVSLNRGDLDRLRPDQNRDYSGFVAATDAAGDVIAVGSRVKGIRKGMRVTSTYFRNWVDGPPSAENTADAHGFTVDGVLGDYIVLDDTAVAPIPAGLTYEEAATLPTAGLTAWKAITGHRSPRRGDVVLVQGTGGVSVFAVQFAVAHGARVIVTSSSDEKLQRLRTLGAIDGINYRSEPKWAERVLDLTNRKGADFVVDIGGKATLEQSVQSLAYAGTLAVVGGVTGYDGNIPALELLLKNAHAQGVYVGSRADYTRMGEFIAAHRLHPVIERVYRLEEFQAALDHLASGGFVGKIVLRL